MRFAQGQSGQTLVETAVALPVIVLFAVVFAYAFLLCRQLLRLQPAASEMATLAATSDNPLALRAMQLRWLAETMGGRGTPPISRRQSSIVPEWRKARGLSVTDEPGRIVRLQFTQAFLPHLCGDRLLSLLKFNVVAAVPMEPPIPREE